jgi:carboxylate-amine ligase
MEFKPSDPTTVGVELEFQILDAETLDLADGILPLMARYDDRPYVRPEFFQSTVEIASKVCRDPNELETHLRSQTVELRSHAADLGFRICGAGSHPFSQRLGIITPLPRYRRIESGAGYLGHTQITFATHVHVGMTSGDEAVEVMRRLKAYLPLLVGVTASSPFWRGYDTGFASYRHRILAATRSYGIPPSFENWAAFSEFFAAAQRAGVCESVNDIHWDLRPRPHLGTLEVRVADSQPTVSEAVSFSVLVCALISHLRSVPEDSEPSDLPKALPWWTEKENHYQASRLGLQANYVRDEQGTVDRLIRSFESVMVRLGTNNTAADGYAPYLDRLRLIPKSRLGYERQREAHRRSDSLRDVVAELVAELDADLENRRQVSRSSDTRVDGGAHEASGVPGRTKKRI